MRRFAMLALVTVAAALSGCVTRQASTEAAYVVNSQGAVSPIARSALAGSTAAGKQEIIGVYVPFVGTGLALKAGLEWDGTPTVIEVPVASAPQAAAPQTVTEYVTEYVPETRMVPRTRAVQRVAVPVPAAPAATPCAPRPPEPPPVSMAPAVEAAPLCTSSECAAVR